MSRIIVILVLASLICSSCHEKVSNPNRELSFSAFAGLNEKRYHIDSHEIRAYIAEMSRVDGVSLPMDRQTFKYYSEGKPFIWINRLGLCNRADTLLSVLLQAGEYGLGAKMLRTSRIEEDIRRMHYLDVDDGENNINAVMARLEYNLTRAYFRYSASLRFGLVNPDRIYNNYEEYNVDSVTTKFRQLSELRVERPHDSFYTYAVNKACNDSIGVFIAELQPRNKLYGQLIKRLNDKRLSDAERLKTICNIERCRWRLKILSGNAPSDKYVEVNIPSFSLRAVNKENVLPMRVGCGTLKNKTPLLTSKITRMDVNPQWIVPKSISTGFIHNFEYMHKMGMFVFDKKLGKLPPEQASYEKVMKGEQYVIQAGGPKNSLGRIIFRFDNNFSVFLHDTSSPWVFKRERRAVSHGCVRVEKPYELALFLLDDVDEKTEDRLKYSMTVQFVNDNDSLTKRDIDRKKLVNSLHVKPSVPLFITYYTIYYGSDGQLADYPDVYGYDEILAEKLKPYVE